MILRFFFVVSKSEEAVSAIERGVKHASGCEFVGPAFAAVEALSAIEYLLGCCLYHVRG